MQCEILESVHAQNIEAWADFYQHNDSFLKSKKFDLGQQ